MFKDSSGQRQWAGLGVAVLSALCLSGGASAQDKFKVGMAVEAIFDDVTDTITLPKFKPA